jgi:hypothetical protein
LKKEVQFHESRHPVSPWIVLIALIFLPALSVLLTPASAAANRYDPRRPCRQNITISMSAVDGTRGTLTNFPVLINSSDTNLKSGRVQPDGNDICFTSSDKTTRLPHKTGNFTQSTGNPVAWASVSDITSTPTTTISLYYGNLTVSNQQNAEAVFSRSDLLYGANDLPGVADIGMAVRKDLA